jgi:integrase
MITRAHAEEVMRKIPASTSRATRRHVAQLMGRVLNLAVYPLSMIPASPLPRGFLPKSGKRIAFGYLYPVDDARLLACVPTVASDGTGGVQGVPLPQRLLYGFLAREGMRCEEALSLTWADVDLERGTVRLDENKTDDARTWALGADVARALEAWKKLCADAGDTDRVFIGLVKPYHLAKMFRAHLRAAGVTRPELFERTESRRPIRVHDLRATFVTLALAIGKSETWVSDRTGHRSSVMLARYRRAARNAGELGLGWLAPLDAAIPELAGNAAAFVAADAAAASSEEGEGNAANAASSDWFQRKDSNLRKRNQNPLSCH